jgi:hypothetical protein
MLYGVLLYNFGVGHCFGEHDNGLKNGTDCPVQGKNALPSRGNYKDLI